MEALSSEEERAIRDCAEEVVIHVMLAERDALEVLYEHITDFDFIRDQAGDRASELENCLQQRLPEVLGTRALELRRETLRGIARASDEGRVYLHTLNRSVLSSFFLIRDPHHAERIREHATRRMYFLDTNVYLAWLYESQPAHDIVAPLLSALSRHGAKLRILPKTVNEIKGIEEQVSRAVPRALAEPSFANFLVDSRKAIFTDFWWARRKDRNLQFSTYALLHMDPDEILPRLGVEVEAVEFEPAEDFPSLIPTFRNAIRGAKEDRGRVVRPAALGHDAHALVAMAKLQLRGERDDWGCRVQFLSLDSALGPAIDECRNVVNRRFEKPQHPTILARLYLPSTGRELDREEYETFVVGAIRESLGVLAEISGYSHVEIIEKLDQAGIPTRTLLTAPPELLGRALSQLQGRHDLNRKLDQALAQSEEDRKPLVEEIQRDLEEAISVGSDLLLEAEAEREHEAVQARALDKEVSSLQEDLGELKAVVKSQADELSTRQRQVTTLRRVLMLVGTVLAIVVLASVLARIL